MRMSWLRVFAVLLSAVALFWGAGANAQQPAKAR